MGKVKGKTGTKRIDLSGFKTRQSKYVEEYDPEDGWSAGFTLDELEEMGAVSFQKTTKIIPDGEIAFFSVFKQGEDF